MNETFTALLTTVLPPIMTMVGGWYVGKRQTTANANATELQNVQTALSIYREMVADLSGKLKSYEEAHKSMAEGFAAKIKQLEEKIDTLEHELESYKNQT